MPKKQTTAGKKARAAARGGEKYTTALRRQLGPGAGAGLEHRGFLDHAPGFRPFRDTGLFERIGGQPTVDRLVDLLYAGIADDDQLRPLFGRDVTGGKPRQKMFFAEWLGGPRRYSEVAWTDLKHAHDGKPVTRALAGRWLGHFNRALGPRSRLTVTAGRSSRRSARSPWPWSTRPHRRTWPGAGSVPAP